MIETNLTEFANLSKIFDPAPMTFSGVINGSPMYGEIHGNVSAVVSQPGFDLLIQMNIILVVEMTLLLLIAITLFYFEVTRRRRL